MINKKNNTNFLHCCASKWGEVGSKMMLHIAEMFFANPTTSQHLSDASSFLMLQQRTTRGKHLPI
ncbi:WSSV492 [White spot syndrome virus]|uniref:WSSV492 n=1 Tax=White spot syndrome virus TaxID=342409 RepID=A0A2I6SCF0_9VIRU|nr:WSSV492 [White spot syndrome virus]